MAPRRPFLRGSWHGRGHLGQLTTLLRVPAAQCWRTAVVSSRVCGSTVTGALRAKAHVQIPPAVQKFSWSFS